MKIPVVAPSEILREEFLTPFQQLGVGTKKESPEWEYFKR
jgi:hypothetical protein